MKQFLIDTRENLVYYKLAIVRGIIYCSIPGVTLFLTQTETWDQKNWDNLGSFLRSRLILSCLVASATALVAFLDKTLSKLENDKNENTTLDTSSK